MKRFGQVITLRDDAVDEYERLHVDPWPDVLDALRLANIRNYSIYRHGTLLFQTFEYRGDDFESDMETLAGSPVIQRWWDVCKPLQVPLPDRGDDEWWHDMAEIFRMD